MSDYVPPFVVIPFPVNSHGDGPADPEETVRVTYQVWDSTSLTVCETDCEETAKMLADLLNKALPGNQ